MPYERLYAGETTTLSGTLERPDGDGGFEAIPKAEIESATLTLVDAATGDTVNDRDAQDILTPGDHGVTIGATNGAVSWETATEDSLLLDPSRGGEEHQAEMVFLMTNGSVKTIRHRIHCTDFLGLTDLEEVSLQLSGVRDDQGVMTDETRFFLELMIDAVTARVERECYRVFRKPETATAELCGGYEQRWLGLRRWPVTKAEITSIKEAPDGNFADATAVPETDYQVTREGLVIHRFRNWVDGPESVQVVHSGGMARHVGGVDADLRMAATRQVCTWWMRRKDLGVSGSSVQGASVTLYFKGGLCDQLKELIPHLKRRNLVL